MKIKTAKGIIFFGFTLLFLTAFSAQIEAFEQNPNEPRSPALTSLFRGELNVACSYNEIVFRHSNGQRARIPAVFRNSHTATHGDIRSYYNRQGGSQRFGRAIAGEYKILNDTFRVHVFERSVLVWKKRTARVEPAFLGCIRNTSTSGSGSASPWGAFAVGVHVGKMETAAGLGHQMNFFSGSITPLKTAALQMPCISSNLSDIDSIASKISYTGNSRNLFADFRDLNISIQGKGSICGSYYLTLYKLGYALGAARLAAYNRRRFTSTLEASVSWATSLKPCLGTTQINRISQERNYMRDGGNLSNSYRSLTSTIDYLARHIANNCSSSSSTGSGGSGAYSNSMAGKWRFGRVRGNVVLCTLTLTNKRGRYGYVINSCDSNESYWELRGNTLIFRNRSGRITTRFTRQSSTYWKGPFLPNDSITHFLSK